MNSKTGIDPTKSIYYNQQICNINILRNLDISLNYNNLVQHKNYDNLTKKQIYSLFINSINNNTNNDFNNNSNNNITSNNTTTNLNIYSNTSSRKIINLYNNIFNNFDNLSIKHQDISQSLYCQKNILTDFPDSDIRKYININNYKWFTNPDSKFPKSNNTVKTKYPQLFNQPGLSDYTANNKTLLTNIIRNYNLKNLTKSQIYSYMVNNNNFYFKYYKNKSENCKK